MAYRPGQGLNNDALERLRARKAQALPAEDDSKQWDSLLGEGAKKKTRCGVCTRPLRDDEQCKNTFVCSLCDQPTGHASKADRRTSHTRQRRTHVSKGATQNESSSTSDTRSTSAGSECQTPRDSELSVAIEEESLIATVTKVLCHRWVDAAGKSYIVQHEGGSRWTCAFKQCGSPQIVSLSLDAETHMVRLDGNHFLDISGLRSNPHTIDNLSWYHVDNLSQQSPDYVWRRDRRNEAGTSAFKEMMRKIAEGPPPYPAR
jgi:hypothetical protein